MPRHLPVAIASAVVTTMALAGCAPGPAAAPTPTSATASATTTDDTAPSAASPTGPALGGGMPEWGSLGSVLPQVPGMVDATAGLPVLDAEAKDIDWPAFDPGDPPRRTAPLEPDALARVSGGLPDGFDAAGCPALEDLVGPTTRTETDGGGAPRFFFAGQVLSAELWHEYPETLYDIAVLAPYAGTPSQAQPWHQYYRAHGDPLGLSGEPLGYGFALEPGKVLLISGTAQNSQSSNGYVDQLPYELVDGWWEPVDPSTLRFDFLVPQVDRFPAACLAAPTA